MIRRVSSDEAAAQLPALMTEVVSGGTRVIIERHGRPFVALVRANALDDTPEASPPNGHGALALVGAWDVLDDDEAESLLADIYARRDDDRPRPVPLER